ncbi:hypothetical protein [Archangium sp.]|uniref:hypothetical protein n=1 Tax=Archangium sp. TaxID=1872627 RepID=UPI00286B3D04|nr:hypothetical protein [Archangium sp.]
MFRLALALALVVTTTVRASSPEQDAARLEWMLQRREARVRKAHETLGVTWTPPDCSEGRTLWRGVYLPSFHPPLTITFRGGPDAELRLTWMQYTSAKQPPTLAQRTLRVPEAAATALEARLTELRPWELRSDPYAGADGITVHGTVCSPAHGETHFIVWSPSEERNPLYQRYFLSLLEATLTLLGEDTPVFFEGVQGYLTNALLAKDLGGSPRVVRLPAGYSIDHREPLARFFAAIPETEDVIVDLRSFEGAGTALKSVFVKFDTRPKARTLWVFPGKEAAAYLTKYLGVRRSHIVPTMEEARRRLARKTR